MIAYFRAISAIRQTLATSSWNHRRATGSGQVACVTPRVLVTLFEFVQVERRTLQMAGFIRTDWCLFRTQRVGKVTDLAKTGLHHQTGRQAIRFPVVIGPLRVDHDNDFST